MVRVTDKDYYMEDKLKNRLDQMIDRCTGKNKLDNLIVVDGDEGYGKSTFVMGAAYYVADQTKRPFTVDNVFFNISDLIKFARETSDQIIVWDEAALGGLSTEWRSKYQIELTKLLMVARKKRHFMFFCIPKFFKLNEYILVDRAIAMIHVYARNEKTLGRFCYFNKKQKEKLFYERLKTRQRKYRKLYNFHGSFPNILSKVIDEKAYDQKKDEAILSLGAGEKKGDRWLPELRWFKWQITKLPMMQKQLCEHFQSSRQSVNEWSRYDQKYPEIKEFR